MRERGREGERERGRGALSRLTRPASQDRRGANRAAPTLLPSLARKKPSYADTVTRSQLERITVFTSLPAGKHSQLDNNMNRRQPSQATHTWLARYVTADMYLFSTFRFLVPTLQLCGSEGILK